MPDGISNLLYLTWPLALAAALICLIPGLSGPFLFDDFASLPVLRDIGGVHDSARMQRYLASGFTGPSGRPIATLSFLIDDNAWPSDPRSFKYTNLKLHVLNGCLLFWLTFRLALFRPLTQKSARWIALLVTAFWLLHPLNVSTVLYVVQRMAILATLFVLGGLILYVIGRDLLRSSTRLGYFWMSLAIVVFTPLAVFSKENGALLPLLALVIERCWLRRSTSPRPALVWECTFLSLPSVAVMGALLRYSLSGNGYDARPFSLSERLLTEPIVLMDYLLHWLVPFMPPRGLFTERYPIAHGLFDPPLAAAGIIAVVFLIAGTWRIRHRHPATTLAIGFFFAGHLLESTSLPLEIYFEHRNYLPAMLLFLPVAELTVQRARSIRLLPVLVGVLLFGMAFTTHRQAGIWGDETRLALTWAKENPYSSRAQNWAADILAQHGRPDLSTALLRNAIARIPDDVHLQMDYLVRACITHELKPTDLEIALDKFRQVPFEFRTFPFLEVLYQTLPSDDCPTLDIVALHTILDALQENPIAAANGPARQLHQLRGILYVRERKGSAALDEFRRALNALPTVDTGLGEVAILASAGFQAEALRLLGEIKQLPEAQDANGSQWQAKLNYVKEIERLQQTLESDLQKKSPTVK